MLDDSRSSKISKGIWYLSSQTKDCHVGRKNLVPFIRAREKSISILHGIFQCGVWIGSWK
jgi:hypothetical protein